MDKEINHYRSSENAFFKAYQLEPKEYFIKVEELGTNIRFLTVGSGHPVLFVHGGPAAGSTWVQLMAEMETYQCIFFDRPGCGLSEAISYGNLSREKLSHIIVSVIDQILNHLQIKKLPIVANSFGGYLTLLYVLQRSEKVTQLIFEGCPAMVEGMKLPFFMKTMLTPGIRWIVPKLPTTRAFMEVFVKQLGHTYAMDHNLIPETFIEWYMSLFNDTKTQENEISMFKNAFQGGEIRPEFMVDDHEIETISQPTLWLWGKEDPFGGIEIGQRFHAKMKNSSFISFDNSGHLPWIDQPNTHATHIKKFIEQ